MIDFGLLTSVILAFSLPSLAARYWPLRTFEPGTSFFDATASPAAIGLIMGRLAALSLDDPRSIGRVSDMMVIRSGVEFWPAAAIAALFAAWSGRRAGVSALARLGDLAPLALLGYGAYEAACLLRDGCYGPVSSVGIRPHGMTVTMVPVGVLLAVGVAAAAAGVRYLRESQWPPGAVVAFAVAILATLRSVASIWLPRVGASMTRQHRTSVVVAVVASSSCLLVLAGKRRRSVRATVA